jgi:methylmalonyl-CoA/ethylmalonyl-CoA epimerase
MKFAKEEMKMVKNEFKGLSKIGQINVPVRDLPQAVEFYRDSLGINFLFEVPNMAFFDCDGVRLMLGIPEDESEDHPSSILYFKVGDIHTAADSLKQHKVNFISDPHLIAKMQDHDLWMAFFEDLDGNTLALMAEMEQMD